MYMRGLTYNNTLVSIVQGDIYKFIHKSVKGIRVKDVRVPVSNLLFAVGTGILLFIVLYEYQTVTFDWMQSRQHGIAVPTREAPHIALPPPAPTPPPTPIPTPTPPPPTPTPVPQVPVRIAIPKIGVNSRIVETTYEPFWWNGQQSLRWKAVSRAVGHHDTTARPGEAGNMVLSGHNNTAGAVFRYLPDLTAGDEIIVYTADETHRYHVEFSEIVRWTGATDEQIARHLELGGNTSQEALTLISCWPYATYTHRIYVRALPVKN